MRPGQTTTTELEAAILEHIAKGYSTLALRIGQLHVLSREFTGVGSYTTFAHGQPIADLPDAPLSLGDSITLPRLANGLGAILFCEAGNPTLLEIHTYGDELWDGDIDGFSIKAAA